MKKIVFVTLIFLWGCCSGWAGEKISQLSHKPPKETMTKIVFRNVSKGINIMSYDGAPVTVYLYADKYSRVEEAPDVAGGLHGLIIMEDGQSWSINLFTDTANYHHIDSEFFEMSTPLIPLAKQDRRYGGLTYGQEIDYFKEDAKKSITQIDGVEYATFQKEADGIQFELICKKAPLTPFRLNVISGQDTVFQYIFDEYKRDLPVDLSLFEVPDNIDIMPVCAPNTSDEMFQTKREQDLLSQTQKKRAITKDEAWSLACSGMLWELKQGDFESLAGRKVTKEGIEQTQTYLKDKWNIKDREELFQAIYWLMMEGYQVKFDEFGKRVVKFSAEDFEDMDDADVKKHIQLTIKYYPLLPKGIAGWDYGAAICLSRWGHYCGYLSEKEAWYFIKLITKAVRADVKSWDDYGKSYFVGWNFMPAASKTISSDDFQKCYDRFSNSPDSPWAKIPWGQK